MLFFDETHIHIDGNVNKQNYKIYRPKNSHQFHEEPFYPVQNGSWYGIWAGGVNRALFFEDVGRNASTVNRERYNDMISAFLWSKLDRIYVDNLWFQ